MTAITLPESLRFYYESPENTEAINLLVGQLRSEQEHRGHDDMDWDNLENYHKALLAAHQIQVDLWVTYKALWEEIWAPFLPQQKEISPKDYEATRSLPAVWETYYERVHQLSNGQLYTGIFCDTGKEGFGACFYYYDTNLNDTSRSNVLHLSREYWLSDAEDDVRWSRRSLVPIPSTSQKLDVTPLALAAKNAISTLKESGW